MTDQTKDIPNQRGTSSGELGQNPVEIINKHPAPPESKPSSDAKAKEETTDSKG